jgi:FkbM family methyltransferase
MASLKKVLRRAINSLDLDIVRVHRSPKRTLLGMKNFNIRTVIDVGANQGQFARMISSFFPDAGLYCFEPLACPFRVLSAWAQTQGGRVRCFQMALGDVQGEVEMHLHMDHTPSSSFLEATERCHELYPQTQREKITKVYMTTLDEALKGELERMPRDILLKLDVQGFEDRVLLGGQGVLAASRACILEVNLAPLYDGQATFLQLTQILYEAGLRYAGNLDQAYEQNGRVVFLDAVFVR